MKNNNFKRKINVILKFARPHKLMFLALFSCIIITTFSGAFFPYIFGRLVDEVFYGKDMGIFLNIVIIYGVIFLFNQIMHFALNMSWARLMTAFLFDIKEAVLKKAHSFKGEKLASGYSGDMVTRMGDNTDEFMNFIHWNVFYTIGGALNLILCIMFICYINIWLGVFTILLTPVIVYLSRYFSKRCKKYYAEIADKNGLLTAWIFEIINGMQDIKLLGALKHILSDYTGKTIKIMRLNIKSNIVEITGERVNSGISLMAQMILYSISTVFILNGKLTIGGFTACVTYFGNCVTVFNNLNSKAVGIANNMANIERVCELFEEESEDYNLNSPYTQISDGKITFSDVSFSYNEEIEVLKNISLEISAGQKISLVGRSGEGKTTIANLLYKLFSIKSGKILIDDINIDDYNLHSLRAKIGIVHQDSIIFDGTLRFNLSFSDETENDEKLWQALRMSHLYDFVKTLPKGLDTIFGYDGISLSGGQKQRLAIARIFVKNPKILIFDEATSSLDSESESVIRLAWDELCRDRTILIIAHRLSTISNSDKVAVLKSGEIVGFDKHDKLIKSCNTYATLFKEQYARNEVEVVG